MKRFLEYQRLRSLGFTVRQAWQLSGAIEFDLVDRILAASLLILLVSLAGMHLERKLSRQYYLFYNSAVEQKKLSEQYKTQYKKYEKVVLGCLVNQGIIINNVNHECLIRPYRERF